jgi:hypothetical protein
MVKKSKEKLAKELRDKITTETGISNSKAMEIASDAVRGRNLEALALQKGWPVSCGKITGPLGELLLCCLL